MSKTIPLIVCAAMSALLAGCATSVSYDDGQRVYNEKLSRAKNLADPFGYKDLRDVKAPDGMNITSDGSLLLDTAGWAANFHAAAGSGFLPGTSNWGSALGWGLGISLLSSAFAPTPITEKDAAFGYVPLSKASTLIEARNLFAKQWTEAMASTLRELYPNAEIETDYADYKKTMLVGAFYVGAVSIKDESIGCFGCKGEDAKRPREDHCTASIAVFTQKEVLTTPPSYFGGNSEQSYRVASSSIYTTSGQKNAVDWTKIMAASVKYLPEHTVVYVAPHKTVDGKKTPPVVLEKDRINFFVKPAVQNK